MAEEKKAAEGTQIITGLPEEELLAAFSGPAIFANKFYVTMLPSGVRITFVEAILPNKPPVYRGAFTVSYSDAIAFRDLLSRQLDKVSITEVPVSPASKDGA